MAELKDIFAAIDAKEIITADYAAVDGEFIYAASSVPIAQIDTIDTFVVAHSTDYIATINGTDFTYGSDALTAQVDTVDTITVADSTTYSLTINGTTATYDSGVGATSAEITLGLVSAINLLAEPVTATDGVDQFTIQADAAGIAFSTVITAGIMNVTTTTANSFATEAEIIAGLVSAINLGSEPVTAADNGTSITLTADVAGVPFTATINANMVISTTTDNITGPFTITLPQAQNEIINILDVASSFSTSNVTLEPGTNTIMGASTKVLSTDNSRTEMILVGTDWRLL